MLATTLLIAFVIIGIGFVLILTDLVTVPTNVRANVSKVATILFLALITWFFVVLAMSSD